MLELLKPDSKGFIFDVPDMKYWFKYATDIIDGYFCPFEPQHVENTILGWRRFPGDEHKSFWWLEKLNKTLTDIVQKATLTDNNYSVVCSFGIDSEPYWFVDMGIERNRFNRWKTDRHLYVKIYKYKY